MKKIETLRERVLHNKDVFKPDFFRLTSNKGDREDFERLLDLEDIYLHDEIYDQLKELIKSRNPTRPLTDADYEKLITAHTGGIHLFEYGVWVYYPWNKRLVHILDEEEFIEVRTSRNQYKITNKERDLLATKKVGVIGLSVGQSVSVTMAMERGCGELRLADFDVLELTNYNRIRTSLHNLGIKKVVAVAREIMEIDPYLNLKCYPDGITEDNIDSFIDDGTGKLDLLIDECDSVDIKILCRLKAKAAEIPVLMEASDRGTIDVERFDLEPQRPILHGKVAHLDLSRLKHLKSYEEKVPYILPIAGTDTLSTRMKASMLEIGRTITTWPQLASAVALGGGVTADIARRIFLDEYHDSGRYFVDVEDLISDKEKEEAAGSDAPELSVSDMEQLIRQVNTEGEDNLLRPEPDMIREIVAAGILAPSKGNVQPWRWHATDSGHLFLFANKKKQGWPANAMLMALGAATENVVVKAQEIGLEVATTPFPTGEEKELVCMYRFYKAGQKNATTEPRVGDGMAAAIPQRRTNREVSAKQPIAPSVLDTLIEVAATADAGLRFLTEEIELSEIGEIIARTERIKLLDKQGHQDFVQEIIWNEDNGHTSETGIRLDELRLGVAERVAYSMVKNAPVVRHLDKWDAGYALEWFSRKYISGASAIGLLRVAGGDARHYFHGGRAIERVWLAATRENIAFQPLNTALELFYELEHNAQRFSAKVQQELGDMKKSFNRIYGINDATAEDIMLFRVFISDTPATGRSLRMPADKVLSFSKTIS